jgi:PAS domain S-box-containing protein
MTSSLRVLSIDDSEDDTRLIINELQRGGFDLLFERVNSPETIKVALEQKTWDVVISNFVVSQCTALEVLALLQEKNLDLPFIIVSDTMSEDIALQAMKTGIHSFFKKKNIRLLVSAVERGLREAAIKRARQQAEEALISSNQELNDIIEFLPDATFVLDNDKKVIAWNRAIEKMTGVKKEDMIGQGDNAVTIPFYGERRPHLLDLIDVSDKELESKYQYVQRKGNTLYAETYTPALYGGKGAYVWATGAPLFDAQGNRMGAVESIRDITERKHVEDALRVSEERFRIAAESTTDLIWEWNTVNGTLEWFGAIDEKLGYPPGGFPRTIEAWENSIHPDDHDRVMASLDRHLKTKALYYEEYYIKRKDGTFRFWTDQGKAIWDAEGNPLKMIGACTDITERKQAEKALRQSQLQQKALLDNIPDAAWLKDSESRFVAVNEAFARGAGDKAEDLVGKTDFEMWSKDEAELYRAEDQEIIATKQKKVIEQSFMDSSGKLSWVEKIKTPILDDKGKVIGTAGISRNITKRKQTEQELRENEKNIDPFTRNSREL